MTDDRPNPDDLLAEVQSAEERAAHGRLTVFFGYSPGVGKTYAMLGAGHRARAEGIDVVIGYVEPHARPETLALLAGLEALPPRAVDYQNVRLQEFDLDAALARRPRLMLVDELAHSNAAGSRHAKRWQDVEELLEAGIDVYATLNVQHLESLNDVVAQITGVRVRETLPDSVLERADEFELVDLPPESLLERLREGKVYVPEQAERALRNFFSSGNLASLRELTLRRTADHVNRQVLRERVGGAARRTWPTRERLLVCYGGGPGSARVLRTARRLAAALQAEWIAVHVETSSTPSGGAAAERLLEHQRLAERLGAETATLSGDDVGEEIVRYARRRNASKIVVGKTAQPRWKLLLRGSIVDELMRRASDIDVYVIHGGEPAAESPGPATATEFDRRAYASAAAVVALCGLVAGGMFLLGLDEANLVMVFLLGVAFVAARYGRGPGVAAAVAGVLAFDFFFVPPHLTFAVSDAQYLITFAVMLGIALLIGALTSRVAAQAEAARRGGQRSDALYRLSRQLAAASGVPFLVAMAARQLAELFPGEVAFYLAGDDGRLATWPGQGQAIVRDPKSEAVAAWVFEHQRPAGAGTDTLPDSAGLFTPLVGSQQVVGVLAVRPGDLTGLLAPEPRRLLEACASQIALAIERDRMALAAQQSLVEMEAERLRSSLLSSVSHDLRTPLAAITGAATSLAANDGPDAATRRELLHSIADEAHRLSRLVENLLQMTRLESGSIDLQRQWCPLEEVVGSALRRAGAALADRPVSADLPADLPLVDIDDLLVEQLLLNLLENAGRYSPPGAPIELRARLEGNWVAVEVADRGPGLPAGEESRVFDKFYRGPDRRQDRRGAGLGLAICRAIVAAHGGRIEAHNRPQGGAVFRFTLPRVECPTDAVLPDSAATGAATAATAQTIA